MPDELVATKLRIPRRRRSVVRRPRLDDLLDRATTAPVTLVSAPAGFGKTTLLTEWLTELRAASALSGRAVAWVALDQRDNDPRLFWTYLVEALRMAVPGAAAAALALLESPQIPIETVLTGLLNELDRSDADVVLVLDDYHVIDLPEIQAGVAFVVDHLPRQLHLVIAGRADPPLPLARLRARGDIVEIRAAELRFTAEEAATYLTDAMGLALTGQQVSALEGRTEGWIAALQLAALSLQGRADPGAFIAGFAGDDRYIVDYLVEEVVQLQPERIQRFLLRTAVLDRLSGPLCDAVTGQTDGRATLADLERSNLFLFALDDRRQWYRYHQLFADVLRARLHDEQVDEVPELHVRASVWYEQNDDPAEAIRHALTGRDFPRAADLVERTIPDMARTRREVNLRTWLQALPADLVDARPTLSVGLAGAMLLTGQTDGVEERLGRGRASPCAG